MTAAGPGAGPVRRDRLAEAAWWGTGVFAVAAVAAAAWPDGLAGVAVAVDLVLFLAGLAAMGAAYVLAVGRSRTEAVHAPSIFMLTGDAVPAPVKRRLLGAVAVEVAVALATAAVRPYTALAFGILVPAYGLGLAALWAARHATFPARPADPPGRPRR